MKDLVKYGDMRQFGGILPLQLTDGPEAGVRGALIRSGSGLNILVLADRGMDIGFAEYKGRSLNYNSPTGFISPAYYEPQGNGWLRGFYGGLLVTGGLTYMGAASVDEGEELGLHGRASYIPARNFCAAGRWEGDNYVMRVSGEIREAKMFGPNVSLNRQIKVNFGEKSFDINDTVTNEGFSKTPFMILYHFNLGYPLLSPNSKFISTSTLYVPRDDEAWKDHELHDAFEVPIKNYKEKVYFHDLAADEEGYAYAGLINDNWGIRFKFKKSSLKRLVEWKMMGEGTYVLGVEPSNALVMGRAAERKWGTLEFLEPGEKREISVNVEIIDGKDEVNRFLQTVQKITDGSKPKVARDLEDFIKSAKARRARLNKIYRLRLLCQPIFCGENNP
ncbi:MAG: aldose 1-epimerase family protein [Thermoprotei archaeon]